MENSQEHVPFVYPEELSEDKDAVPATDADLNLLHSMLLKSSNPAAAALVAQAHHWAVEASRLLQP